MNCSELIKENKTEVLAIFVKLIERNYLIQCNRKRSPELKDNYKDSKYSNINRILRKYI